MDAQNAVEPASTKPASPKRPGSDSVPSDAKPDPFSKDRKQSASASNANDEDGTADGNSDAETIVLPGKDGHHSPSKVRKIIKREDKSDTEDVPNVSRARKPEANGKRERDGDKGDRPEKKEKLVSLADHGHADRSAALAAKKKKLAESKSRAKDGSSGLSSAPASPPQRRRRVSNANSKSDSETAPVESPKLSTKERPRTVEKLVPHKRKAPRPDSDDEAESRKVRRQRTSGSGLDASRKSHAPAKPHHDAHPTTRNRSISPHAARTHRRSISTTQLPGHSSNGLSHKKKRVPAPLQSTDYHSDESSASGSPHPRSSKLRSLTTPATTESTVSPAKMVPHKKHLDAHGQTFLARACAKGEYETAKHRLQERPEDINVADYAGNTPLQIAALNGYDDIVKLLVDAGCNLECVNNDKDTPLLDAVENGHLEVVRILLAAGVNPRKANAYGQEPIDRVNEEMDHADEIRRALQDAKQKIPERRPTSEDHHPDHPDARSSHGPESPRRSPGAVGSIHAASGRRAGTVRSTKTSNHLLYMPMDDKTLRAAAARGDEETVTRILQVRENFDDPESMVAAARGGHDIVMQLLLALGKANPDPPIPQGANEFSTPMLAAIGQENIKVVRLLLDQNDFNPIRRYKGETYHEIARRRRGPNWAEEEHMLKDAFDNYDKHPKVDAKTRSPNKREQDRDSRRSRPEAKDEATKSSHKRKASSPTREPKKPAPPKLSTSPKDKRRSNSFTIHADDQASPKRGPGRPKKDDRVPMIAISDREASPAGKQPMSKAKRAEPDLAAASSEGETVKPRRKLVSGRELKGERAQQNRRASLTSTTSSLKEPLSPREEPEKSQKAEKYHDRTKALKRDESRDRIPVSGDASSKRHRSSATPPHAVPAEKDALEGPAKRRRLDIDGKERTRLKPGSSDDRRHKASSSREPSSATTSVGPRIRSKSKESEDRKAVPKPKKTEVAAMEHGRRESGKSVSTENSIHVKSEDPDVDMPDADQAVSASESRAVYQKEREAEEKKKRTEAEAREAKKKDEERRRAEEKEKEKEKHRLEEEAKRRAEAEARRREEEEKKRQEEEERRRKEEEERKQRELEELRKKEEEAERLRQEEEERRRKEEEDRKRREEVERKRRLEEEKKRKEEEERIRKEEEERKRREEEERLRREQLEREAAEELRRKQEEERKELERKRHEEEMERRRFAVEAERAARLEQERVRLANLPPLLRWLDGSANPKVPEVAERFRIVQGVRYDCIRPEATGTPAGREQWLLNTQVALLLGEKDLELKRCKTLFVLQVLRLLTNFPCRFLDSNPSLLHCQAHHLASGV